MADAVTSGTGSVGGSADIGAAIDQRTAAYNHAIQTNLKITTVKTELGAEESAAQQRPNIG